MPTASRSVRRPTKLTLHVYQVGFGDCFLLTFHYPRTKRHILIDYGTTGLPPEVPKNQMQLIAKDIAATCEGKLHAVVVTHRHRDHISGFQTNRTKTGTGDQIRALAPDVVVQPWTEDPRAKRDATRPTRTPSDRALVASLDAMQPLTSAILSEAQRGSRRAATVAERELYSALAMEGFEGVSNPSAVKNLATLGKRRVYVYHGSASGLATVLPGVRITVLGPPTVAQTDTVLKQRSEDDAEFWRLEAQRASRNAAGLRRLFPKAVIAHGALPPSVRWFVPRLRNLHVSELRKLVRIMDTAMNNTSVILLFEIGRQKLLFPGDAQIENWAYALARPKLCQRLEGVTLYKVGHHGSRNATPITLWNGFRHRAKAASPIRLRSVVSTMAGKHGTEDANTEVPRQTLVAALQSETDFFTTQALVQAGDTLKHTFDIRLA